MAPKRRQRFGGGGKNKRKKLNLITLRQKKDYVQFGQAHPVNDSDNVKSYLKIKDKTEDKFQPDSESSDSEEEVPIIKQLMAEIGVKEEEPESEKDSEDEDGENESGEEVLSDEIGDEDDDDDSDNTDNEGENQDVGAETSEVDGDDSEEESEGLKNSKDLKASKSVRRESPTDVDSSSEEERDGDGQDHSTNNNDEDLEANNDEDDESEDENEELCLKESDPFTKHFELDRDISAVAENSSLKWQKLQMRVPGLGDSLLMYKDSEFLPEPDTHKDLKKLHVKHKLCNQVSSTNSELAHVNPKAGGSLNSFQHRLFCVMNSYQDLLYPKQTVNNTEEIRLVYCLHALNHVLKTRSRVIAHNTKLKAKNKKDDPDDDQEYRDQGLTRPKVLILLPYRDRALKVVNMMIKLLSGTQQASVSNLKRFESEYSQLEKSDLAEKTYKPEDFRKTFEGNTDDTFRLGMNVSKKSLRLYSPFYDSDIIIASPLGLRMVIGLEGDKERDVDFLSSVEVLIVDQADIFLMQNWDHFMHVFKHLHLQPKESHGVDFSRVRMWSINGWSKHYRQTLMLSCVILPELLTVFNKHCHNYAGKLLVQRDGKAGTIGSSASDAPQIFHRVSCSAPDGLSQRNAKFEYFKKKIVPYHTSAGMKQTLIYCNYFSFVLLRNYFRESEMDYLFINEYDSEKHMRNARIHFRKRHPHFLVYTERLHFHYRFRLRGIHHIVWFDLPQYPQFYPELVNLMETTRQACTTTALFTKYDAQKLMEIAGNKQATHMLMAAKSVNMITVS